MLCSICRVNQASIHIQEDKNGSNRAINICQSCADRYGMQLNNLQGDNISAIFTKAFSLMHGELPALIGDGLDGKVIFCKNCTWDSEKLKRTKRVGCSHCYKEFKEIINNKILLNQAGKTHKGSGPIIDEAQNENQRNLERFELKRKLEELVRSEKYEEAALLRDRINNLKYKN